MEGLVSKHRAVLIDAVRVASGLALPNSWLAEATQHDVIRDPALLPSRAAWAACAIILIDMVRTSSTASATRASHWFGIGLDVPGIAAVEAALLPLAGAAGLLEIFPYLLDTYGRTSRLDVMRDALLGDARRARKGAGSFYTPADVADFMVASIASPASQVGFDEWWFDPACGSGVFLVAALRRYLALDATRHMPALHERVAGADISPQACDFAAFAILSRLAMRSEAPLRVWSDIRRRLVAMDATKVNKPAGPSVRGLLPEMDGAMRLVCNPPYGSTGTNTLASGHATRSLYLPFVEMAWTIADGERDAAALVVPLALAANRSGDHRRVREGMGGARGRWTLLFFDRQPHALFGEDAKTRAVIAIRRPGPAPAEVATSGLLKWTSRQRARIFKEDRAVPLGRQGIGRLVPKLASRAEAELYRALEPFRMRSWARPEASGTRAADIVGAAEGRDVLVAGTAYNFLNAFRGYPSRLAWHLPPSASVIHRLRCLDDEEADATLAIVSSRLAFWLWHVECDGFHVPAWFLDDLPLLNVRLDPPSKRMVAELGRAIWSRLQDDVVPSVNGGRLTFAFRPTGAGDLRGRVDEVLMSGMGVTGCDPAMLEDFERRVVSIDGKLRLSRAPGEQDNG